MFFSRPGEYEACGIFTVQHLILLIITLVAVVIAIKKTMNTQNVRRIIKRCTILICILEVLIIVFKIATGGVRDVNNYVPLYYCSLLIYAGIFSSFAEGKLRRVGDVFLATGSIIGGIIFILFPSTSLPSYPMFHLVSIHSFLFHGIMIYVGVLINITNYIELKKKDINYYFSFVGIVCVIAYIVNKIFDSNLMFISKGFPGTIIDFFYKVTGKAFTPFMILGQAIVPFYSIYGIRKICKNDKLKQ